MAFITKFLADLRYYEKMLLKHIDLVDRRLIKGEVIPHQEKIFSIFQDYTDPIAIGFIKKGKLRPNVKIGKKTAITTDQFDLMNYMNNYLIHFNR